MQSTNDPLDCPKCGRDPLLCSRPYAEYNDRYVMYVCVCLGCEISGDVCNNEDEAIKTWNKRVHQFKRNRTSISKVDKESISKRNRTHISKVRKQYKTRKMRKVVKSSGK